MENPLRLNTRRRGQCQIFAKNGRPDVEKMNAGRVGLVAPGRPESKFLARLRQAS